MAIQPSSGLTYADLEAFPDDGLRRELIGGELFQTASPAIRHQQVVMRLSAWLFQHANEHGGEALSGPTDVVLGESDVVVPDVLYITAASRARIGKTHIDGPADIIIEVSSPSTRRLELVSKRDLYARMLVPEYWFIDLDADRIEVYRLDPGYDHPVLLGRGETLTSPLLPGLALRVDDVLGPPED